MKPPRVIAHRGASRDAPENTLAAFRLAWEQGADAIETDLRLTADGALVAIHDADGRRTLGDPRRIRDLTLAELRALDAGRWKHPSWTGERVPALADILAATPPGKTLVLELKEDLVDPLARELPAALHDRTTLIAFDERIIASAKRALPRCRALWLFDRYSSLPRRDRGLALARRIRELGVDGIDLKNGLPLNENLLAPLRAEGRTILAYTINHPLAASRCARLGIDGLTTDRPAIIRRWLGISA